MLHWSSQLGRLKISRVKSSEFHFTMSLLLVSQLGLDFSNSPCTIWFVHFYFYEASRISEAQCRRRPDCRQYPRQNTANRGNDGIGGSRYPLCFLFWQ